MRRTEWQRGWPQVAYPGDCCPAWVSLHNTQHTLCPLCPCRDGQVYEKKVKHVAQFNVQKGADSGEGEDGGVAAAVTPQVPVHMPGGEQINPRYLQRSASAMRSSSLVSRTPRHVIPEDIVFPAAGFPSLRLPLVVSAPPLLPSPFASPL